jgi:CRP-like cAMP-binding protein
MKAILDELKRYLLQWSAIPPSEWLRLVPDLRIQVLKKGELFFRQGEPSEKVGMLIQGLARQYFENPQGKQFTRRFLFPGMLTGSYPAMVTGDLSRDSMDALEKSIVVWVPYSKFEKLLDRHGCWERLLRKALHREVEEREIKEYEFYMFTARERYRNFEARYPALMEKVPQYLIASYLGITPVALSRIRTDESKGRRRKG